MKMTSDVHHLAGTQPSSITAVKMLLRASTASRGRCCRTTGFSLLGPHALWGPNEFIVAHVLSGVIQSIGSTLTSVPLGGGLACESVTTLPGNICNRPKKNCQTQARIWQIGPTIMCKGAYILWYYFVYSVHLPCRQLNKQTTNKSWCPGKVWEILTYGLRNHGKLKYTGSKERLFRPNCVGLGQKGLI
jgi:hypothetical protein